MVNLIELPINAIEAAEDTPFLADYFPTLFAEALVPLNPQNIWLEALRQVICQNLATKLRHHSRKEYLETSLCDVQWRDRFWKVFEDTTSINLSCEAGQDLGSFGAGAAANKMADKYMEGVLP
jgi:hypothetical protein